LNRLAALALGCVVLASPFAAAHAWAGPATALPRVTATSTATASPTASPTPTATATPTTAPKPAVKPGVTFNDPDQAPLAIENKLIAAIDNASRHADIRVMTWNFNAPAITNALIRAHDRGATVRVIMARTKTEAEWFRLVRALKVGNADRLPADRSMTRTCNHSCRGTGGSEHAKWVTISRSGSSSDVVMEGSFNLTTSAVRYQWNDWYTVVGDRTIYDAYQTVFQQAMKDKWAAPVSVHSKFRTGWFAPRANQPDVVMTTLNKVQCSGATNGTGTNGHTRIRVASAVIQQIRGEQIASRLRQLVRQGCDVRVLYTLSTHTVLADLAGVPTRHMAWDNNGDGEFDRYLHMKAMSISGHYGTEHDAHVVFNGSANWSRMGIVSDEQGFVVHSPGLERAYTRHIDALWARSRPVGRSTLREDMQRNGVTDPYAGIRAALLG
jgi:phosphatidylserine/phosphatidylglycerophosphate/cardiolipin synthase-like enzyme